MSDDKEEKVEPKRDRNPVGQGESAIAHEAKQTKSLVAQREEDILEFWSKNKIFEKSLEQTKNGKPYVFYDGPPFATGTPHYGHILTSALKDAVPRYQTMRGRFVERRWGWDCHGLPIENIVEKDLGISGKKQIEEIGVKKFNEYAKSKVFEYVGIWKKTVERIGRWVDFDGSYKTMDNSYIESVWWAIKEFYKKGLVYEGTKVLPYCPRCETPIANSEIAMDGSYKDITDISVYVRFELLDDGPSTGSVSSLHASTGQAKTYVLAWTTTPWTLPGNFALAINPDIKYVQVKIEDDPSVYIMAEARVSAVLKDKKYTSLPAFSGKELIGKKYKPLFPYFVDKGSTFLKNQGRTFENAWKIYSADFVTTESGTGVVHVSPGYGEDDMNLARKENIPFIHHVTHEGKFTNDVTDFAGMSVKPKTAESQGHQVTDIEIIKKLAHEGKLFAKEKIVHSYPHCFRCETPLYYYAIPAWFIKIQSVKNEMLTLNEKINWIPEHLKDGRFKKGLEAAPDWNISRNRFWASPLPIWKCDKCARTEFVGSVSEIAEKTKSSNHYTVVRHGEAESNVKGIVSSEPLKYGLTDHGKEQVKEAALSLKKKGKKFDYIIYSPFKRTHETAEILREILCADKASLISDDRLHEISLGEFNDKPIGVYRASYTSHETYEKHFFKGPPGGESQSDAKRRVGKALQDIDSKYSGKNILLVTHDTPAWLMFSAARGLSIKDTLALHDGSFFLKNAEARALDFLKLPMNDNFELDLHRPYIDEIRWLCKECEAGTMWRISEVVDCWFESGSMPFAQMHYPFEHREKFHKNFPAQFISEYIAQTRTWFYYTHAVSSVLFKKIAFENVVAHGTVLAADGSKMSKSKQNFPDPWIVFDRYGVDAVRFYLLSSPIMRSEDLNFSEKEVDGIYKKNILRLRNVLEFYKMYAEPAEVSKAKGQTRKVSHILDRWIVARLEDLHTTVTENLDRYLIDQALRPFEIFIDDLSTWYLRRSRERLKGHGVDREAAIGTLRFVLLELSKLLAPFTPFIAEDVYQTLKGAKESVHLETWPAIGNKFSIFGFDGLTILKDLKDNFQFFRPRRTRLGRAKILGEMAKVRHIVSLGLEVRSKAGIKVRQPLASLKIRNPNDEIRSEKDLLDLIKDEVNVKEIIFDKNIANEVELDTTITAELKEEGIVREFIRSVQEHRKKCGLVVGDRVTLVVQAEEKGMALLKKYEKNIVKSAQLKDIIPEQTVGESVVIEGLSFVFSIRS